MKTLFWQRCSVQFFLEAQHESFFLARQTHTQNPS